MALFKKRKEEVKTEEKKETEETKRRVGLPQGKDPALYRIIEKPVITEKAVTLAGSNKYVFKVWQKTNKVEVRKAIEKLYGVKVKDVRVINTPGKKRQVGRFEGWKPGFKKAIVTLEKGHTIEVSHT
mgnify:CR=1 FL=1